LLRGEVFDQAVESLTEEFEVRDRLDDCGRNLLIQSEIFKDLEEEIRKFVHSPEFGPKSSWAIVFIFPIRSLDTPIDPFTATKASLPNRFDNKRTEFRRSGLLGFAGRSPNLQSQIATLYVAVFANVNQAKEFSELSFVPRPFLLVVGGGVNRRPKFRRTFELRNPSCVKIESRTRVPQVRGMVAFLEGLVGPQGKQCKAHSNRVCPTLENDFYELRI